VYYQLGDRFSEDPFVLFQLRGRTKEQILDDLRRLRSIKSGEQEASADETPTQLQKQENTETIQNPQTPLSIEQFWHYHEPLDSSLVVIAPPPDNRTVLDILGTIPLASADARAVRQYLDAVYQTVSQQAVMSALNWGE
jgi:uncharacterized Zn finger protein